MERKSFPRRRKERREIQEGKLVESKLEKQKKKQKIYWNQDSKFKGNVKKLTHQTRKIEQQITTCKDEEENSSSEAVL